MLTPVGYLWVFTILPVLGDGCCCCVPCLELALLVIAFSHRLQWRTYRTVPIAQVGCSTLSKCVWDTGKQIHFWQLYPFPFSSRFGCVPDSIRYFSTVSLPELLWCGSLLELFSITFSLLVWFSNSLTPWKLPSARIPNAFSPSSSGFLTLCFLCRDRFSQPFLGLLYAIPSLSVIGCTGK